MSVSSAVTETNRADARLIGRRRMSWPTEHEDLSYALVRPPGSRSDKRMALITVRVELQPSTPLDQKGKWAHPLTRHRTSTSCCTLHNALLSCAFFPSLSWPTDRPQHLNWLISPGSGSFGRYTHGGQPQGCACDKARPALLHLQHSRTQSGEHNSLPM